MSPGESGTPYGVDVRPISVVVRRAAAVAVCLAVLVTTAPPTSADPEVDPVAAASPAPDGQVASNPPATLNTPDGWTLGLGAKDESQVPVAPLTTALSSREYLSSGTFVGSLIGPEQPRGELEVGYEIGCGIDMSTSNGVTMGGSAGVTPGLGLAGVFTGTATPVPLITVPVNGVITVGLKPGLVVVVPVDKKEFKGPNPWVMISNFHVKIDGCVGQSFIRSYAVLTRVTDQSDVVLSYVGVTKAV
jgi:MspA